MIRRSLAFKWIGTLLLTSLAGVVLVGLFAYRTTSTEYDRLRVEQAQSAFVQDATSYYRSNQNWDGLAASLGEDSEPDKPPSYGYGYGAPPQIFALADALGIIVVEHGPYHVGDQMSADELAEGVPITVDGERVGTALLALPPPELDPREQSYLSSTTRALLIGAVGASSVALLIGLLLSRHFLRPLTELTAAIRAMRQGELRQEVHVGTQDELGELGQAFNQMSAEIHRANQLRKQMTADIAHDLRTPLTIITGYLEGLRDGTLKPTPERFDVMYGETVLLKRLIDDLRTLSLADAGELKLMYQPVQPRELLEQVRQAFEPLAAEQQVALNIEADDRLPDLSLDSERMMQVMANLVTNALRYTPAGGRVTLQAKKRPTNGDVQFAVSDTGSGIPADKLPNIFERFFRSDVSRSDNGESGLGLAIAKSIVEAHHGTIAAESRVGAGTTITITLPGANGAS